jgi:hypothetical protein
MRSEVDRWQPLKHKLVERVAVWGNRYLYKHHLNWIVDQSWLEPFKDAMRSGDCDRPEAFKVRAGMVGGYRQNIAPETIAWMEQRMAEHMPHGFGYRADERAPSAF